MTDKALEILQADSVEHLLSDKQLVFWEWINQYNQPFSRKDAIQALGLPARTVESIIKKLMELQSIERLGQGRATRYKKL